MGDLPVLPFVVAIPVYLLIGYTVIDIVHRSDLAGLRKALWIAAVVVLPVAGTLIYLLARPFEDPAHLTRRGNDRTRAVVALLEQHASGSIGDAEFRTAKTRIFEESAAAHRARRR